MQWSLVLFVCLGMSCAVFACHGRSSFMQWSLVCETFGGSILAISRTPSETLAISGFARSRTLRLPRALPLRGSYKTIQQ